MHPNIDSGDEIKKLKGTWLKKRFDIFHTHRKVELRKTPFLFDFVDIHLFPNHHQDIAILDDKIGSWNHLNPVG